VEAGGYGILAGQHAARFQGGILGVLQGARTFILQDSNGQIMNTH
jgi:tryptophan synthase beta chain